MQEHGWESLDGLHLTPPIAREFTEDGIDTPTSIQRAAVAAVLSGRNVVIHSGTGTGKTLAYLLPVLQRLCEEPTARGVVMAPSPELAMQCYRVAERYAGDTVSVGIAVAKVGNRSRRGGITKSTRLIIGTPGRLLAMIVERKLKGVTILVLDEPDPILAGQNAAYIDEFLSRPEPRVQIIVVGATIGPRAAALVRDRLGAYVAWARADDSPLHGQIEHRLVAVRERDAKDVVVARFVEKHSCRRAIVFVNRPSLIGHLFHYLDEHRLDPVSLSPDRPKQENKESLRAFTSGQARLLITTDTTARGLDVPEVEWVLHYELPHSAQAYLHRAGRTGRAGLRGRSVVFCFPKERQFLKRYAKELDLEFEPLDDDGGGSGDARGRL